MPGDIISECRARSNRNGGRHHLGMPGEIKSEWWATSSRIRGRLPPESAIGRMDFRERQFNHDYKGHVLVPRCKLTMALHHAIATPLRGEPRPPVGQLC